MKKLLTLAFAFALSSVAHAQVQNLQAASGTTGDLLKPTGGFNLASGQILNVKTGATVSGAGIFDYSLATELIVPNGATPTTTAFGWLAAKNNAWGTGRGTLQFFDGTGNTYAVNVLASSTPSNGYVPTWQTGGTIIWASASGGGTGANPTASVGLTAVNGSATTFLRSDGAPALSQAIVPTWTGIHTFTPQVVLTGGASLPGGATVTGASGAMALAAAGTNQNIELTASGTGIIRMNYGSNSGCAINQTSTGSPNLAIQIAGTTYGLILLDNGAGTFPDKELVIRTTTGGITFTTDNGSSAAGRFVPTTGQFTLPKNITSTSTTTGTVVVTGGVGISGDTFTGGKIVSVSPTSGLGYATGAGGAVTQLTSRTTGVTLSKISGTITGNNTSLAAQTSASFTVTNTTVAANDVIVLSIQSGNPTTQFQVTTVSAGSFAITAWNSNIATADTTIPVINFAVIKAVNN